MKTVVLDAATLGNDLDIKVFEKFGETEIFPGTAQNEIKSRTQGKDIAIVNKLKMNESTLGSDCTLKLICVFATGYDNIDIEFCRKRGIAVCNVVGYSTNSVAQVTVLTALSLVTHLTEYNRNVRTGEYSRRGIANMLTPLYHEISGMTWGIAGYGNIGKAVGKAASALGCNIIAYKRTPSEDVEVVGIKELCERSDIISVHLPLSDSTKAIIDSSAIKCMKDGVILVNMARGAVTDERAVAEAVINGKIGGFACDVYSVEPFTPKHPFFGIKDMDNVILTPHMAWGAHESRARCLEEICKNIQAFINEEKRNRVDI